MKILSDYTDAFGMVTTINPVDGGDSCAHGCAILYAATILDDQATQSALGVYTAKLEKEYGRYVRHPDPLKWYSNIDTFSKDQLIPLLCLLGIRGTRPAIRRIILKHLERLFLFSWNTRENGAVSTNTPVMTWYQRIGYIFGLYNPGIPCFNWKIPDITLIDIFGLYVRGLDLYILYPLLFLCDIPTLISSTLYRYKLSSSTIQMNQILSIDFSNRVMPTPISWLAKKIYGKTIPEAALIASWGQDWQPPVDVYLTNLINKEW